MTSESAKGTGGALAAREGCLLLRALADCGDCSSAAGRWRSSTWEARLQRQRDVDRITRMRLARVGRAGWCHGVARRICSVSRRFLCRLPASLGFAAALSAFGVLGKLSDQSGRGLRIRRRSAGFSPKPQRFGRAPRNGVTSRAGSAYLVAPVDQGVGALAAPGLPSSRPNTCRYSNQPRAVTALRPDTRAARASPAELACAHDSWREGHRHVLAQGSRSATAGSCA